MKKLGDIIWNTVVCLVAFISGMFYAAWKIDAEPQPTIAPANERSVLVRPASASPEDQELAKRANGDAPLWRAK